MSCKENLFVKFEDFQDLMESSHEMDDLDRLLVEDTQIKEAQQEAEKDKVEEKVEPPKPAEPIIEKKPEKTEKPSKPPTRQKKQRKPQMKITLPDIPLDNLPNLSIPTPNLSPIPSVAAVTQTQQQIVIQSNTILNNFEEKILNYLDTSLKSLTTEFTTNLNLFFQKSDDFDTIISTFRKGLMADVQRELQIKVSSMSQPLIPFNVNIDLPHQQTSYPSFQDVITLFKAQNTSTQSMLASTYSDFKKAVHDRNKSIKSAMRARDEIKHLKSDAFKKVSKCEYQLFMLKNRLNTIKERSEAMVHKVTESENLDFSIQPEVSTEDYIYELNSFLPELNRLIAEPSNMFNKIGTILDEEIQDIHKRRFSIQNTTQDIYNAYNS